MADSFNARSTLNVGGNEYEIFRLSSLSSKCDLTHLPFSLKILLENLLRHEDGVDITKEDIEALARWDAKAEPSTEIAFTPARVLLQDFTGVPAVVDLAAMRDAMRALGDDPTKINPLSPAELVIDHSLQVDAFAQANAVELNAQLEFSRNKERYAFLRWGQNAFADFKVVPPDTGIVHQVNLEYLARVVFATEHDGVTRAFPDTVVGTDSHTTMINGLGVLGWGVGGIEAEAAMLGQPITMLIPHVVGFELTGKLPEGATATDLVLTVVQRLRERGVVGKFVEFFGEGLEHLPLADRATIANMAPEYGATCGIFPIDTETLRYLSLSGRSPENIALVEAYAREQGMFYESGAKPPDYSDTLHLDLGDIVPSISGPKRPQDRIALDAAKSTIGEALTKMRQDSGSDATGRAMVTQNGEQFEIEDGAVVIAAITSCTNTSNPAVMVGAALLARNARAKGLQVKPWVKTSLAPGSLVVTKYLEKAELMGDLEAMGFHLVGYGCTTCIGNSGPLPEAVGNAVRESDTIACAVLSGNRNFEGRIHADVRMNFLASPPLVVAYALAGNMKADLVGEALGEDGDGNAVFLRDIWPSQKEIHDTLATCIDSKMYRSSYANVFSGDQRWKSMQVPEAGQFEWQEDSTYVRHPPYFEGMTHETPGFADIHGARVLAVLGDSITTDHISPAGAIKADSPAGRYLIEHGVAPGDFNSYGARRGNHEVMMRGTFANVRLRNLLAPGTEGGWTLHQPSQEQMSIYDAAMRYVADGVPTLVIGGAAYGGGSSRDWAAKGPLLLGIKAVLVQNFERIHRSNLIGMGVLPLQFQSGDTAESLGLTGHEVYAVEGVAMGAGEVKVTATSDDGKIMSFTASVCIDTPKEWEYYKHGGILQYVIRQLAA
ncbi:MAG: aconitate hydratase AcnA [Gammaproteobacteria bacterium]|jgi:aconitate hydratase|nr:aconitate hydratase AcnA [Gammaproteobacteria bacterium]